MKFPSKFTTYKDSTIAKFPLFLETLKNASMPVMELYERVKNKIDNNVEFVEILDCLYAMKKITIEEGILHYVG